jgi:AcrR family transcriptional regulator
MTGSTSCPTASHGARARLLRVSHVFALRWPTFTMAFIIQEDATERPTTFFPILTHRSVAKRAGVGIGTLYRHFPTREALYEAVYRHEMEQLVELARHLEAEMAPVEALRRWLQAGVEFMATKKGMAAALAMAAQGSPDLVAYSLDRLTRALGQLLQRAAAVGEIRADIGPEDLFRTLVGMCYAHDRPGWQANVLRLVDVFIDGLRQRPADSDHREAGEAARAP